MTAYRKTHRSVSPIVAALTAARKEANLSQGALGELIGVGRISIVRWETGRVEPLLSSVVDWAAALGYRLDLAAAKPAGELVAGDAS